jgi:hypothetical protein
LTALNFDCCDACHMKTINCLMDELRDGVIGVQSTDGDLITSLCLTPVRRNITASAAADIACRDGIGGKWNLPHS